MYSSSSTQTRGSPLTALGMHLKRRGPAKLSGIGKKKSYRMFLEGALEDAALTCVARGIDLIRRDLRRAYVAGIW